MNFFKIVVLLFIFSIPTAHTMNMHKRKLSETDLNNIVQTYERCKKKVRYMKHQGFAVMNDITTYLLQTHKLSFKEAQSIVLQLQKKEYPW